MRGDLLFCHAGHARLLPQRSRLLHVPSSRRAGRAASAQAPGSSAAAPAVEGQKKRANEMLSGVLYRQAQQMQQGGRPSVEAPPAPPPPAPQRRAASRAGGAPPEPPGAARSAPAAPRPELGPACAATEALAAYASSVSQHALVDVHFCLRRRAQMGQRIRVVGSCHQLGEWGLERAPELAWSEGDVWRVTVPLPAGSVAEYKYVLLDSSATQVVAWQDGNNSLLALRLAEGGVAGGVSLLDDWYGGPGSKLAVGREPAATRDTRLHTWAGDLFAQLEAQRRDLRRARVELSGLQQEAAAARLQAQEAEARLAQREAASAAALDEARTMRQEVEQLRGRLTGEGAERAAAIASFAQARAANEVLQAQLADTTATLLEAVDLLSQQGEEEPAAAAAAAPVPRKRRASRKTAAEPAQQGEDNVVGAAAPVLALEAAAADGTGAADKPVRARRGRPTKAALLAAAASALERASAAAGAEPKLEAGPKAARARKPRAQPADDGTAAAAAEEAVAMLQPAAPNASTARSRAAAAVGEAQEVIGGVADAQATRTQRARGGKAAP